MNYLAHALLSFGHPHILVGNMISDFVKGRDKFLYAAEVQKGIQLHRDIDNFTDGHPAVAKAKDVFRPSYRLYSGPIVDIVFDHFLANDDSVFSNETLLQFTHNVYNTLEKETLHLPLRFLPVLTYMKMENWLYHYHTPGGIQKSLRGLVRRASFINDSTVAFDLFTANSDTLKKCYAGFFPDVKQMAKQRLDELLA